MDKDVKNVNNIASSIFQDFGILLLLCCSNTQDFLHF